MRLICPGCGMTASAEAWLNDAQCRDTIAAIVKLPSPLPAHVLSYLSLFRPESRALSWKKALRVVIELSALVNAGHIQTQGRVARPCPPGIWAAAIDEMVSRKDRLSRPLKNHNYLRQVAYDLADQADAATESRRNAAEQSGSYSQGAEPAERRSYSALDKLIHGED